MPWSTGLESQRGNITSLLGTLAQMREGKKNRRSALLRDVLGIGAQFGGAALQNQWAKKATAQEQQFKSIQDTIAAARGKTAGEEQYGRTLAAGELDFQRQKELQQMSDAAAMARTQAGGEREQEDASKLIPYDIASQAWDTWWERLQTANPKRQMSAKDFDQFRTVAVEAGAKYGFAREQMEDAVNTLAQSYGFDVAPNVAGGGPAPTIPPVTPRVKPRGFAEHGKATVGGIVGTGKAIAKEAGKAWKGFKESIGIGGMTEQTVLDSLAKAKQLITPQQTPEVSKYEAEIMQAGALPPERLQQIMDRIAQIVRPK